MTAIRRLGGRYELAEALGYGGMAEVYRGRDVRLGRDVAVKVLRAELARDPSFLARFRREAQAVASLNHPAIVSVYDTGEDELDPPHGPTVPYIVMEFVEGRTLRDVLHDEGRVLPTRALEIVAEVCEALEYSHQAGIVHRDIKPGNVMLNRTGDVKVMDFGIARVLASTASTMTQTAAVIGTAQYLSPEQARGEHVDARSDVYSTGCLLYELLAGTPPFTGDSAVAVAYQHVRQDAVPPSTYDADVSPALDAIVLKAMAKNPANRYQSAAEMQADVRRALAGAPVEATPLLPGAQPLMAAEATSALRPIDTEPAPRRRIWWVLLALLAVAAFVAALLGGSLLGARSRVRQVATPALIGQSLTDAQASLARVGLQLGTTSRAFSDRPVDTVIEQSPLPSISVPTGRSVDVTVSQGVETGSVPKLTGLSQADATAALVAAKLAVGDISQADDPSPAGQVISSDPAAGATIATDSKVSLVVSSGFVAVPSVVGADRATATARLQTAGFPVEITTRDDATAPVNSVLAQNPTGRVKSGTPITLVVATSPPAPTPTATPSPTLTPTPSPTPTAAPSGTPTPTPSRPPTTPTPTP
jgi:eukaryotic-like serine/threonine-protein kinase